MPDEPLRPDIQAAASRLRSKMGSKREIKHLVEHLWEGEQVDMLAGGSYGKGIGLLALTDRRLIFVLHGLVSQQLEDFPLDKISSVQWSSGLVTGTVAIYTSNNRADIKNVTKDDGKAITDKVRARISGAGLPVAMPSVSAAPLAQTAHGNGFIAELERLAALHRAGAITDDEFVAAKARILA